MPEAPRDSVPTGFDEFSLIDCILIEQPPASSSVAQGAGDDAAIIDPPAGAQMVTAVDTLVEGVHFLAGTPLDFVVGRALAVNLSDLAAMGARPGPCLLALTHPELTPALARACGRGFAACADGTGAELVGGNLARGPLSVSVTVTGWVPRGTALLRDGARPGDLVCVSGRIGLAALGLAELRAASPESERFPDEVDALTTAQRRYLAPEPRLALGAGLRGLATACIDVSDGLLADLGHLLQMSSVGAQVDVEAIPCTGDVLEAITAGDDYELLFTVPPEAEGDVSALAARVDVPVAVIGRIEAEAGVVLFRAGVPLARPAAGGWRHFSTPSSDPS